MATFLGTRPGTGSYGSITLVRESGYLGVHRGLQALRLAHSSLYNTLGVLLGNLALENDIGRLAEPQAGGFGDVLALLGHDQEGGVRTSKGVVLG